MKRLFTLLCAILILIPMIGCESKPKEVENMEITISTPYWEALEIVNVDRTGTYTGTIQNDLPNGKGKFETKNAAGEAWYYEGDFTDGLFHGKGISYYPETNHRKSGNFVNGLFTPTKSQFFEARCYNCSAPCVLQSESIAIIDDNENIFPCTTEEDETTALSLVDHELTYNKFTKKPSNYIQKLHQVQSATATQVVEYERYGHITTAIIACDEDYNYYWINYDGSLEVYDDDSISFCGLPVANSSFDNNAGGKTNVIVIVGSIVELA